MPETILVAIIGTLGLLIGAVLTWNVAMKKMPKELKVLDTQGTANLAQALNDATQALTNALQASNAERNSFETRINELEAHRDMRSREIYTLQQTLEKMQRDYVAETQSLRINVASLQAQVDDGSKKYEKLKKTTIKLYQALKDANVPIPDIDSELIDTLDKIKPVK
jgi:chromosome segregation ATPase